MDDRLASLTKIEDRLRISTSRGYQNRPAINVLSGNNIVPLKYLLLTVSVRDTRSRLSKCTSFLRDILIEPRIFKIASNVYLLFLIV